MHAIEAGLSKKYPGNGGPETCWVAGTACQVKYRIFVWALRPPGCALLDFGTLIVVASGLGRDWANATVS